MEATSDSQKDAKQGDNNPLPVRQPAPKVSEVAVVNPSAPTSKENEVPADREQKQGCYPGTHDKQPLLFQMVERTDFNRFERSTLLLGWFGLGIGLLSLLAAGIAGFFVYHQWREMNSQTGYMNRAAIQARSDSAASSAATAKQLEGIQAQITAAQDGTKALQGQLMEARHSTGIAAQLLAIETGAVIDLTSTTTA
jgi:uncharacterized protein (UPF0333 family)